MQNVTIEKELIAGNCEHCGFEYEFDIILGEEVVCPSLSCGLVTENWDTVDGSQFAPYLVKIN